MEMAEALYKDFMGSPDKAYAVDVFAAYWLMKSRLADSDHLKKEQWWWSFYKDAERLGFSDDACTALTKLDDEFPMHNSPAT